jgi:hypothetical protein
MQQTLARVSAKYALTAVSLLSSAALLLTQGRLLLGWLVGQFGLSETVAALIVSIITTDGIWAAVAIYPFLAPFVATVEGLIFLFGTSVLIGW